MTKILSAALTGIVLLASTTFAVPAFAQEAIAPNDAERAYIHRAMAERGFVPMAEMAFARRDVRRVQAIDPRYLLSTPGIELERHRDGRLTLRVIDRDWTGDVFALSAEEWEALAALETAAFAPLPPADPQPADGVVRHCESGMIAASPDRAAGWGCDPRTAPARAYGHAVIALAMAKGGCAGDPAEAWSQLGQCFPPPPFTDGEAEARLRALNEEWSTLFDAGRDPLFAARDAIRAAPGRGRAGWLAAREAVFAFGRHVAAMQDLRTTFARSFPLDETRAEADAFHIEQARRRWGSTLEGPQSNYRELLQSLAALDPYAAD